ncbi:hypothetical protein R4K92_07865 [Brachyspira intermedia]|uniref:hypothetical protein n=1 Tax=Brachyspira intermedia TaxID=84377 RepID=UPI003007BDA3
MKNKRTFFICIFPLVFIVMLLIIFSALGNINRIGYLNEIKLISNNTYSFRISYYNKIFRNNDIYGVYLNIQKSIKDNSFIKEIKMDKKGSPFGILVTDNEINIGKIDSIQYNLKIKNIIYFYAFITYIFIVLFLFSVKNIKNALIIFINFIKVNKKISMPIFIILFIFVILLSSLIILGKVNRIGYLNEIKLISNNTYSFRISYYNKIFRNSDIYGVYLNIQKVIKDNNFIKEIKMDKKGSPFGILITDNEIDIDKINNIEYSLKINDIVYLFTLIIYLFSIFIFYGISIYKENKLVLISTSMLIVIQIFIYLSLYNYFRIRI